MLSRINFIRSLSDPSISFNILPCCYSAFLSLVILPILAIWVVIKVLCLVCVIFNINPEEDQGMPSL
ncbi:hypothetical protein B1209_15585 [Raoultella planticola]|uniref:Uncharacterized protein n=1 Tax=Raoultella planticola TaxID=575 RepID=A0A443VI01_RAOPL|nr:hypothetical protein CRT62_15360 [Raoultella planticola]ATM16890.1 hypothetical protein CRN15_19490 [Raoultella planticola]AUU05839.1 hypothetical protein MC50_019300 [Raoultella planticola]AUV53986.1 hypothetical protein B1209_15585 [Raoultella planticola]OZP74124.1 hypothetical protein CIG23_11285 [Raoultella planticola]